MRQENQDLKGYGNKMYIEENGTIHYVKDDNIHQEERVSSTSDETEYIDLMIDMFGEEGIVYNDKGNPCVRWDGEELTI